MVLFASFLRLKEEGCGGVWPDIVRNSLLFGLLGAGGHQQLAGSPVMEKMHTAPFEVFANSVAGHLNCQSNTVSTAQHPSNQREEDAALERDQSELRVDCTATHCQTLESDERIQTDRLASSCEVSSDSSFPPWVPITTPSNVHSASHSRRGRGRVDARSNNCSQVGSSSGTVRGHSSRKPAQTEVPCKEKKQSPKDVKDVGVNRARSTAQSPGTRSAFPVFGAVQIKNRAGELKTLEAEVDPSSLCTILTRKFLEDHLPDTTLNALQKIPRCGSATPIHTLEGTVDLHACLKGRTARITAYIAGAPCQPRIGADLILKLGLVIHGGHSGVGHTQRADMQKQNPNTQSSPHSNEPAPNSCTVKRVQAHETSSRCGSVPEPSLEQNVHKVRTEHVDESEQKNLHPAVEVNAHMHAIKHTDASGKRQPNSQASPFRPLFRVGSFVLARRPRGQRGRLKDQRRMRVERALGRYQFILSDGEQWSARQLMKCRRPTSEAKNAADH